MQIVKKKIRAVCREGAVAERGEILIRNRENVRAIADSDRIETHIKNNPKTHGPVDKQALVEAIQS